MWLWTSPAGTGRAGTAGQSANGDGWVTLGLASQGWGEREKGKDCLFRVDIRLTSLALPLYQAGERLTL